MRVRQFFCCQLLYLLSFGGAEKDVALQGLSPWKS